jgi:hypothetical protein
LPIFRDATAAFGGPLWVCKVYFGGGDNRRASTASPSRAAEHDERGSITDDARVLRPREREFADPGKEHLHVFQYQERR